ncbi:hypothetical protein [Micromonospora sp. LH3U1]|uniref:hypothetical protein n=1 Tax=Micromonospora sp. LH3U1 TaxID=3018339 RepID=UPI00234BB7FA|nr:hypothetical protein [Micromonospora sp. LH3U1]WCN83197.1 hypothetical protein PCA76_09175 [Micromonospora sp. LH3U1]
MTLTRTVTADSHVRAARHHGGRVRHRRLERVVGLIQLWVAPFVALNGQRIASYWDCYHRRCYPR